MAKKLTFEDFVPQTAAVEEAKDITKRTPRSVAYKKLKPAFIASYINTVFGILLLIFTYSLEEIDFIKLLPEWLIKSNISQTILLIVIMANLIAIIICCGISRVFTIIASSFASASLLPFCLAIFGYVLLVFFWFVVVICLPIILVLFAFWDLTSSIKDEWLITEIDDTVINLDQIRK